MAIKQMNRLSCAEAEPCPRSAEGVVLGVRCWGQGGRPLPRGHGWDDSDLLPQEVGAIEGSRVRRWLRKTCPGLRGSLGMELQAGRGWSDLPTSLSFQNVHGAEVADSTGPPEPPAEPPE